MKSSTGAHFIALDHVRALAAFIVFAWHFTHGQNGYPVPFEYVPAFPPLSILDEGHTGVALFMTLSGYLFAKLIDGKSISYPAFLWNRALRLLPLLSVVVLIVGIKTYFNEGNLSEFVHLVAKGAIFPTLPNGGWSITVEFHYYLILPLFLLMLKQSKLWPLSIIFAAIALRFFIYQQKGEIQSLAYWTIVGRIDQFALGMIVYQFRSCIANRHILAVSAIAAFTMLYWLFDLRGGFFNYPSYPSPSRIWTLLPTIEGIAYAIAITWYDTSFSHSTSKLSSFIGRLGEYSYSIYLLHFFVVFDASKFIHEEIMDISNFYLACLWALALFVLMIFPAYLTFRFIEAPFLKLRRRYVKASIGSLDAKKVDVTLGV